MRALGCLTAAPASPLDQASMKEPSVPNTEILEAKLARRILSEDRRETAAELVDRVATALGRAEEKFGGDAAAVREWSERFAALMTENRFWPSGRILNNAGARQSQLASCFVLPIEDDFGAIFDTLAVAARCHQTGGGTGFDLTPLRERGADIHSSEAGGASGPVSWLRLFDAETAVVAQGGKMRGANLASLSVRHPDIMEFIDAKRHVGWLHNFNISVAADDEFMHAVAADHDISLVSPMTGATTARLPAREVWFRICENAWRTGDPGLLFPDTINRANPLLDHLGPIRTTNPCGEQTLYPYEASNLGSVNLAAFADPRTGTVDWSGLERTVCEAVRLLDNAIEVCQYPEPRITEMAHANRRLGLGVMGFADLLIALGIAYDSEQALELVDSLGGCIMKAAWAESERLAEVRGAFPNAEYVARARPARNCAITTIAPTGTISMVAGCSSGIEPRFAPYWNKDVLTESGIDAIDEDLMRDLGAVGLDPAQAASMIRERPLSELPLTDDVRRKYRYAHSISGDWHVRVAARWQQYTDNAVSKTVNLPHDSSVDEVSHTFLSAWKSGCKGVSLYREGSRDRDLLTSGEYLPEPEPVRQSRSLASDGLTR